MTNKQEQNKREGYEDAICSSPRKHDRDSYYYEGYMIGQLTKMDWAMQDIHFAMSGNTNGR